MILELFFSFFQIGLFSIGGGYAAIPLIQNQVVEQHGWLTMEQFADVTTIAEMTPGPIAINAATFVGTQIAGFPGALVATLGCITPSCIIVMALAYVYNKYRGLGIVQGVLGGLRPAVVAMIASAGITLLITALGNTPLFKLGAMEIDGIALIIFVGSMLLLRLTKAGPIPTMAAAGLLGLVLYGIF